LSTIKLKVDYVKNITPNVGKACVKVSNVKSGISSVRSNLDHKVISRRNISSRLTNTYQEALRIETKIIDLKSFLNQSVIKYSEAEKRINYLVIKYGINDMKKSVSDSGKSSKKHKKMSIWDKLKVGYNAVKADAKKTYSKMKEAFSPGGSLHKEFQIGKAIFGIAIGTATVIASVGGAIISGGSASPFAIMTAIYGVNEIISGTSDLINAIQGDNKNIGKVNVLKSLMSGTGGVVGGLVGHKELGKEIGQGAYYLGSAATIVHGAWGGVKNLGKLKNFKGSGFGRELKNIIPSIKSSYNRVGQNLSQTAGIRKIKQALNPDKLMTDLKNVKQIKDIANIRAVQKLREIDYGYTYKRTMEIAVGKPLQNIFGATPNLNIAANGVLGVNDVIISPIDNYGKFKDDYSKKEK
jgi:predicted nucleic acid-binding protein